MLVKLIECCKNLPSFHGALVVAQVGDGVMRHELGVRHKQGLGPDIGRQGPSPTEQCLSNPRRIIPVAIADVNVRKIIGPGATPATSCWHSEWPAIGRNTPLVLVRILAIECVTVVVSKCIVFVVGRFNRSTAC